MNIHIPCPEDGIVAIVEFDLGRYVAGAVLRSTSPAVAAADLEASLDQLRERLSACWPAPDRTCSPSSPRATGSMRTRSLSTGQPPRRRIADYVSG